MYVYVVQNSTLLFGNIRFVLKSTRLDDNLVVTTLTNCKEKDFLFFSINCCDTSSRVNIISNTRNSNASVFLN